MSEVFGAMKRLVIDENTGEITQSFDVDGGERIVKVKRFKKRPRVHLNGEFMKLFEKSFNDLAQLSPNALRVLVVLLPYVGDNNRILTNSKNGKVTIREVVKLTGLSYATSFNALKELNALNILRVESRKWTYLNPKILYKGYTVNPSVMDLFKEYRR